LIDFDLICFQCGSVFVKGICKKCYNREYGREYNQNNRESISARGREYYQNNRESIIARSREYRRANRESTSARLRAHQKANPELYQAAAARRRVRIETGMSAEDRSASVEWRRFLKHCPCFYCGEFAEVTHVDHMLPLSRGGTDHWHNLQQSCQKCNLSKGTKTAEEFQAAKSVARINAPCGPHKRSTP